MPLQRHRRLVLAMMLGLWAPLAAGLLVGWVADGSLFSAILLFAEPLLVVLAVYCVLLQLLQGRVALSVALAVGVGGGLASLHLPAEEVMPRGLQPAWAETLRSCAAAAAPPRGPIRVLHADVGSSGVLSEDAARELGRAADIVVLQGTTSPASGRALARVVGGQFKDQRAPDGGLTVVVRGGFRACGGTDDAWALSLPAVGDHGAIGLVTLAQVEGAGVVPLVALRLDGMHNPTRWGGWPERLADGGARIASVVRAINPRHAVVVGDLGVPPSFRKLGGLLAGAGLYEQPMPPTWPATLGPLPALPLHRLDRLWTGSAWTTRTTHTVRTESRRRVGWTTTLVPDDKRADQAAPR